MPLLISPLVIFALVLVGIVVSALVALHIWRSRIDRRRTIILERELENANRSFVVDGCGLRGKNVFRGCPLGGVPGRSTRKDRDGVIRGEELDLGDLHFGAVDHNAARGRGGPSYYHMSGGRDGTLDEYDNPFATPNSSTTTTIAQNSDRSMGGGQGTWYAPNGDAPLRNTSNHSTSSKNDLSPSTTTIYYDCDLATSNPERMPYYTTVHSDNNRRAPNNSSGGATVSNNDSSLLRYGVTVSTVTDDDDSHDIANAKPTTIYDGEGEEGRERSTSGSKRSSIGRNVSKTLAERKGRKNSGASRETLNQQQQPLEVHPWRLSYT